MYWPSFPEAPTMQTFITHIPPVRRLAMAAQAQSAHPAQDPPKLSAGHPRVGGNGASRPEQPGRLGQLAWNTHLVTQSPPPPHVAGEQIIYSRAMWMDHSSDQVAVQIGYSLAASASAGQGG
jgi:hypothetical protein